MGHPNVMTGARKTKCVCRNVSTTNEIAGAGSHNASGALALGAVFAPGNTYLYVRGNTTTLIEDLAVVFDEGVCGIFEGSVEIWTVIGTPLAVTTAAVYLVNSQSDDSEDTNYISVPEVLKFHCATYHNLSGADQYLMLFDAAEVPAEGSVPRAAIPVPNGSFGSLDWTASGMPLVDGLFVCVSSTAATLTMGPVNGQLNVTYS